MAFIVPVDIPRGVGMFEQAYLCDEEVNVFIDGLLRNVTRPV